MNPNTYTYPTADSQGSAGPSASQSSPLQRGRACLPCRRRKMKCDSIRPICTPCLRGERAEDCEYTDGQRRPRTLTLEEDVARLRARVQELENPQTTMQSVELYAPYTGAGASGAASSSTSASQTRLQTPSSGSYHRASETRQAPSHGLSSDMEADAQLHARRALSIIAPHAAELGFFLNIDHLRVQGTHVLPALQTALTLWSVHITFTCDQTLAQSHERTETLAAALLSRAQTQLTSAMGTVDVEPDPTVFLHVIQTGVLLAYYMQRCGQVVGSRYYASGTWALVTMLKLYRRPQLSGGAREREGATSQRSGAREGPTQESADVNLNTPALAVTGSARLTPALDGIEAEERVRAFWAVYALDRWFSAVYDTPCWPLMLDWSAGNVMTVPWPGVGGVVSTRSSSVVLQFISDPNHDFARDGAPAMHAKASVLLGEAMRVAASSVADPTISQSAAFRTRFGTLDALLQRCLSAAMTTATASTHGQGHGHQSQSQSQTRSQPLTPEQAQGLMTVHLVALAHVTLHRPFVSSYGPSRRRSVDGALGVVRVLDQLGEVGVRAGGITPIYVIVWTALCIALNDEVLRLRVRPDGHGHGHGDASRHREEAELTAAIRKLAGVLSALSQQCPSRFFAANIEAVLPVLGSIAG